MAKAASARVEVRRDEILDAAIACFACNGFHQTTMVDIAAEAGPAAGAIYRYFTSKEDIIEASAQAPGRALAARFQAAERRASAIDALDELRGAYFGRVVKPDAAVLLDLQLFSEALRTPRIRETVRTVWHDLLARLAEIVRRGYAHRGLRSALPRQPRVGGHELASSQARMLEHRRTAW